MLWAAGVAASPAAQWLGIEHDRSGRALVERDLSIPGHPNVFVIGDTASVNDEQGKPVPGIAPAAKQQGKFVAQLIRARLHGQTVPESFRYRHAGNLATIGRKSAVIDFPFMRLSGWVAWWIWGIAHIYFLIGVRSPVLVALNWLRPRRGGCWMSCRRRQATKRRRTGWEICEDCRRTTLPTTNTTRKPCERAKW